METFSVVLSQSPGYGRLSARVFLRHHLQRIRASPQLDTHHWVTVTHENHGDKVGGDQEYNIVPEN